MNSEKITIPGPMLEEIKKVIAKVPVYESVEEFCKEGIRRHLYDIISWIKEY